MQLARYGGKNLRRKARVSKRLMVTTEVDGKTSSSRTVDISQCGIQVPIKKAPEIGSKIKVTIERSGFTGTFEGIVTRRSKGFVSGVSTQFVGVEIDSDEYTEFMKKILPDSH